MEKRDCLEEMSRPLRFREKISLLEGGNGDKEDPPRTATLGPQEDFSWVSQQRVLNKLGCCGTTGTGQPNQPPERAKMVESNPLPAWPA